MVETLQTITLLRILVGMSRCDFVAFTRKLAREIAVDDPEQLIDMYQTIRSEISNLPKQTIPVVLKKSWGVVMLSDRAKERLSELGFSKRELKCYPLAYRYESRFMQVLDELGDEFCTCNLEIDEIQIAPGQCVEIIEDGGYEYATPVWM